MPVLGYLLAKDLPMRESRARRRNFLALPKGLGMSTVESGPKVGMTRANRLTGLMLAVV